MTKYRYTCNRSSCHRTVTRHHAGPGAPPFVPCPGCGQRLEPRPLTDRPGWAHVPTEWDRAAAHAVRLQRRQDRATHDE